MLNLVEIDVSLERDRDVLRRQLRKNIRATGYAKHCTDPGVGKFIRCYGVDNLAELRRLSSEEVSGLVRQLTQPVAELVTGPAVEAHLAHCSACANFTLDYLDYVEDHLRDVYTIACERMNRIFRRREGEEISEEEAMAIQSREIARAYVELVSVTQMQQQIAFEEHLLEEPCTDLRIWRYVARHEVLGLSRILPLSDREVRRVAPRIRLSYGRRMELLHDLSEHVTACPRCGMALQHERKKEARVAELARQS